MANYTKDIPASVAASLSQMNDGEFTSLGGFYHASAVRISDSHGMLAYTDNNNGYLTVFELTSGFSFEERETYQFASGSSQLCRLIAIDSTHFMLAYGNGGSTYIGVYSIDGSYNITEEESFSIDSTGYPNGLGLAKLDATHYALAIDFNWNYQPMVKTFSIDGSYQVTVLDSLTHSTVPVTDSRVATIDSTHFAVSYWGADNTFILKIFSVDGSYDITQIQSLSHGTNPGQSAGDVILLSSNRLVVTYVNGTFTTSVKTFSIDGSFQATEEDEVTNNSYANGNCLAKIDDNNFLLFQADSNGVRTYLYNVDGTGQITEEASYEAERYGMNNSYPTIVYLRENYTFGSYNYDEEIPDDPNPPITVTYPMMVTDEVFVASGSPIEITLSPSISTLKIKNKSLTSSISAAADITKSISTFLSTPELVDKLVYSFVDTGTSNLTLDTAYYELIGIKAGSFKNLHRITMKFADDETATAAVRVFEISSFTNGVTAGTKVYEATGISLATSSKRWAYEFSSPVTLDPLKNYVITVYINTTYRVVIRATEDTKTINGLSNFASGETGPMYWNFGNSPAINIYSLLPMLDASVDKKISTTSAVSLSLSSAKGLMARLFPTAALALSVLKQKALSLFSSAAMAVISEGNRLLSGTVDVYIPATSESSKSISKTLASSASLEASSVEEFIPGSIHYEKTINLSLSLSPEAAVLKAVVLATSISLSSTKTKLVNLLSGVSILVSSFGGRAFSGVLAAIASLAGNADKGQYKTLNASFDYEDKVYEIEGGASTRNITSGFFGYGILDDNYSSTFWDEDYIVTAVSIKANTMSAGWFDFKIFLTAPSTVQLYTQSVYLDATTGWKTITLTTPFVKVSPQRPAFILTPLDSAAIGMSYSNYGGPTVGNGAYITSGNTCSNENGGNWYGSRIYFQRKSLAASKDALTAKALDTATSLSVTRQARMAIDKTTQLGLTSFFAAVKLYAFGASLSLSSSKTKIISLMAAGAELTLAYYNKLFGAIFGADVTLSPTVTSKKESSRGALLSLAVELYKRIFKAGDISVSIGLEKEKLTGVAADTGIVLSAEEMKAIDSTMGSELVLSVEETKKISTDKDVIISLDSNEEATFIADADVSVVLSSEIDKSISSNKGVSIVLEPNLAKRIDKTLSSSVELGGGGTGQVSAVAETQINLAASIRKTISIVKDAVISIEAKLQRDNSYEGALLLALSADISKKIIKADKNLTLTLSEYGQGIRVVSLAATFQLFADFREDISTPVLWLRAAFCWMRNRGNEISVELVPQMSIFIKKFINADLEVDSSKGNKIFGVAETSFTLLGAQSGIKMARKIVSATIILSSSLVKSAIKVLEATLLLSASLKKDFRYILSTAIELLSSVYKSISKTLSTTLSLISDLLKMIIKGLSATGGLILSAFKLIFRWKWDGTSDQDDDPANGDDSQNLDNTGQGSR